MIEKNDYNNQKGLENTYSLVFLLYFLIVKSVCIGYVM